MSIRTGPLSTLSRLVTEQRNPASERVDTLGTQEILKVINSEDRKVSDAVAAAIPSITKAVDASVAAMESRGRPLYIGAGTSGQQRIWIRRVLSNFQREPGSGTGNHRRGRAPALARATEASEDDPDRGAQDLIERGFRLPDVLVGLAASGRTPYVLGAVRTARGLGAITIGVSCTPNSELSREVDIPI